MTEALPGAGRGERKEKKKREPEEMFGERQFFYMPPLLLFDVEVLDEMLDTYQQHDWLQ